jgi:hypothetical protein
VNRIGYQGLAAPPKPPCQLQGNKGQIDRHTPQGYAPALLFRAHAIFEGPCHNQVLPYLYINITAYFGPVSI